MEQGQTAATPELAFPQRPSLRLDRPRIMGIVNLTPDSFSDGGRFEETSPAQRARAAAEAAMAMVAHGAELIDVGGESTRPGAHRVPVGEQIRRVAGPIEAIRAALPDVPISIDTTRSAVAEAALNAGADAINDVSAGRDDPEMLGLAASRGVPLILMHMQGDPASMQRNPRYGDVVAEVLDFLEDRAQAARAAGVADSAIVIDPGIGFGKTTAHNTTLLAALSRFVATGRPVLLGASRKRFIPALSPATQVLAEDAASGRVGGSVATTALGVAAGVRLFRVHEGDVGPHRQAADVAWAIHRAALS